MKKILAVVILLSMASPVFASDVLLKNVTEASIKDPAFRVGLSDNPEKKYEEVQTNIQEHSVKTDNTQVDKTDLTYADLSIKQMSNEIARELEFDEGDMYEDLTLLWKGAAAKSDTIAFALYKLSNPDEDKPNESSVKKVLTRQQYFRDYVSRYKSSEL